MISVKKITLLALSLLSASYAWVNEDGPTRIEFIDPISKKQFSVAPEFTQVNTIITDGVAQVHLIQTFVNPLTSTIQATYVFPLPHQGAVHGMTYITRDSLYRAEIMEKAKAQNIFDSVQNAGGSAALLLQITPNIFAQSLANVFALDTVQVHIFLSMPLAYQDGIFEFAFPTMVADRCCSEDGNAIYGSLTGWNPEANVNGPRIQFNVAIQSGYEYKSITSPSHPVSTFTLQEVAQTLQDRKVINSEQDLVLPHKRAVLLLQQNTYPNKDFVLRLERKNKGHEVNSMVWRADSLSDAFFMVDVFPDEFSTADDRPALDIMFLIDISGSQSGTPLEYQKQAVLRMLDRLNSNDRLCVMAFEDAQYFAFADTMRVASVSNIATAKTWVKNLQPMGGTALYTALQALMKIPNPENKHRTTILLTDGFITNETEIISYLQNLKPQPQVFVFGAGGNLNRNFLQNAAAIGNGFSTEIMLSESVNTRVDEAWAKIAGPQMSNLKLTFTGGVAYDILKPTSAVLYSGFPYRVYGRMNSKAKVQVKLVGDIAGKATTFLDTLDFSQKNYANWVTPKLWAREAIHLLEMADLYESNKDTILKLSLDYQVLSKYSAFIAYQAESFEEDWLSSPSWGAGNAITAVEEGATKPAKSKTFAWSELTIKRSPEGVLFTWGVQLGIKALEVRNAQGKLVARWVAGKDKAGQWQIMGDLRGALLVTAVTASGRFSKLF